MVKKTVERSLCSQKIFWPDKHWSGANAYFVFVSDEEKKPRIRDHSDDDDDTQAKKLITVLKAELDSQGITRDDQKTEGAKVSG